MLLDDNHFEKKPAFLRPSFLSLIGGFFFIIVSIFWCFKYPNFDCRFRLFETRLKLPILVLPLLVSFFFFLIARAYTYFNFVKKSRFRSVLGKVHFIFTFIPLVAWAIVSPYYLTLPDILTFGILLEVEAYNQTIRTEALILLTLFIIGQILFLCILGNYIYEKNKNTLLLDDDHFEKKTFLHRPFRLFLWGGILLLVSAIWMYFYYSNSAIDIQLHDSYFVIALFYFPIALSLIFFFFAGAYAHFYFVKKRPLNAVFGKIHFAFTFLPFLFFLYSITIFNPPIRRYISGDLSEEYTSDFNMRIWIGVIAFSIGQILFLINLGVSIFKKK